MQNYKQYAELETPSFEGTNTAMQFSLIPRSQSPRMQNAYMDEVGDLSQRPGTIPVTGTALGAMIRHLTTYKGSASAGAAEDIYCASGTNLYKLVAGEWVLQTMTNTLVSSDIYTAAFTDFALASRLIIADGGGIKEYDAATGVVKNVVAATDDPLPAPPNDLTAVNAKGIKYVWVHNYHIFVSDGRNQFWYFKRYHRDYIPSVQYFTLARNNDYINGCGVTYNNVCLIPMRRAWAILAGENFDNFNTNNYLNTTAGVVAPRSIARLTYPDGRQTIAYFSDDGAHEIYDTFALDTGVRQYATQSLMKDKIDFIKIGLTDTEKSGIVGFFDAQLSLYLVSFVKGGVNYTYAYDVRNGQWYTDWLTFSAKSYARVDETLYFAGSTGHLHKFDAHLNSDWNEKAKTTKTPIHFKRYGPASAAEFSGFESMWDAYLVESKQWLVTATLDITFIFSGNTDVMEKIIKNQVFIEDISEWDVAKYANIDFTDTVNEPGEILFEYSRLSKYAQVLWENDRDEPVKVYKEKWKARVSGR